MRVHFLPSETTYLKEIERAARKRTRLSWTCPKSAVIGETAFLLINGAGIVAAGVVDSATKRIRTGRFAGRYEATISRVRMLPGVVPFTALRSRFPKWGYPTYPRSYATIESPLADQVREFIDLFQQRLAHRRLRRKQKVVQMTGQQLQKKSVGHVKQTMRWRQGRNPVSPYVQMVASPENSQLDYKVQTKTKIITAKKIEAGLLKSYQRWLAQQGREISAIKSGNFSVMHMKQIVET